MKGGDEMRTKSVIEGQMPELEIFLQGANGEEELVEITIPSDGQSVCIVLTHKQKRMMLKYPDDYWWLRVVNRYTA